MRIGLLSDTHGFLDDYMLSYFKDCDEVWHAGDLGSREVAEQLEAFKPLRAVTGNIDGMELRVMYPEDLIFECGGKRVWITHIGGYPPSYQPLIRIKLDRIKPDIFICGHSHILKIMPDPKRKLLHINPGAAGHHGFHKVRTMVRFTLANGQASEMEVIELGTRGKIAAE